MSLAATVFVSEWISNRPEKKKARLTDEEQEQEDERKKAEKARIEALRVTHDDIKIRRKAHDQWRHEPKGPTKYELKEREERMLREHEEAMKRKEITTTVSTETRRKKGKIFDDEDTNRGRHRGAPKIKPPSPPNPNPFGDRFDQANELRGKIIPAPIIRDKTPKTGMSRGETGRDTADEVNDLLNALQTEPERDDHHEKRKQLFTGDSWSGRLKDDDGYKADELKRRSKVMEESANLDWLCAELEVFETVVRAPNTHPSINP
jgi:hypothetical protein